MDAHIEQQDHMKLHFHPEKWASFALERFIADWEIRLLNSDDKNECRRMRKRIKASQVVMLARLLAKE